MSKKKICVISSYAYIQIANNYGALLQYFALERYLEKRGHKVFWLRYILDCKCKQNIFSWLRKMKTLKSFYLLMENYKVHRSFCLFTKYDIKCSKEIYSTFNQIKNAPPQADYYITGSDQVWGGTLKANYLLFVNDDSKKLAYAASFGRSFLTEEQKNMHVDSWIRKFSAVSVRESEGVDICKEIGVEAVQLLDPTLLLNKCIYLEIATPQVEQNRKYIFGYFLNIASVDEIHWRLVKEFIAASKILLKVTAVQDCERFFPKQYLVFPSPQEWLQLYNSAESIITNTFHGTVFAIVFQKPFVYIVQKGDKKAQNCRVTSLLNVLNLNERLWDGNEQLENLMNRSIDWNRVNFKLNELRKKTDQFFTEKDL